MARRLLLLALIGGAALVARYVTTDLPVATPAAPAECTEPSASAPPSSPPATRSGSPAARTPAPIAAPTDRLIVRDVSVKHYEREVYFGDIDLAPTLARIERGVRRSGGSDDETYQNRERVIPKKPRGYWRKYVHPTRGIGGAGPQRVILGKAGEVYYTPDHYVTFRKVRGPTP